MALRRIICQLGILACCIAFILTMCLSLREPHADVVQSCLRAIGAGIAILFFTLLVSGLMVKLGGSAE